LPFAFNGKAGKATSCAGTMYSGRRARKAARSASTFTGAALSAAS
jgi:hypothetical protein